MNAPESITMIDVQRGEDGKVHHYEGVALHGSQIGVGFIIVAADREALARVLSSFEWEVPIDWDQVKRVRVSRGGLS